MNLATDYIDGLAEETFRQIVTAKRQLIEGILISSFEFKPADAGSLAGALQSRPDIQAQLASVTGYTPSRWVLERARQLAVKVGIRQDEKVQILGGLKQGQSVVATGAYGLPDNTRVSVEAAKEKETETEKGSDKSSAGEEPTSKDSGKEEKQ